ncbi:hypothetical protein JCGZ_22245 [Jatropha curcas]|uniref:Uncharacterized protein n=1 Tax=Jatropha curcas TaxID=180498 RepID=A0A067JVV6_JATCU|nr:hypothetical protein JCGZ_22245 [Jatropha curcas]
MRLPPPIAVGQSALKAHAKLGQTTQALIVGLLSACGTMPVPVSELVGPTLASSGTSLISSKLTTSTLVIADKSLRCVG